MNEVLKCIKERRTTRKFKPEQIKDEELQMIVEAGLFAPSGENYQPWHFTVVQNKELLDEMNFETKEVFKKSDNEAYRRVGNNEKFMPSYNAPTVIIVSGNKESEYTEADCAAATQNMLLAAHSLGVASCWAAAVTVAFNGEKNEYFRDKLNIPDNYTPFYAVLLGYSDNTPSKAPKRKENTVNYMK
ncbi:MAG: nitroreductase family protein [Lachnospiraceae bacterium]|nr:nitroreductase family protein [Lachnospiraceae bacterium]